MSEIDELRRALQDRVNERTALELKNEQLRLKLKSCREQSANLIDMRDKSEAKNARLRERVVELEAHITELEKDLDRCLEVGEESED